MLFRSPQLTEVGSKRKHTVIGQNTGEYDGKPYGGYYTQDQVREIVAYAADRNIIVIPEIDLPGHMLGALAAYPQYGCTGGPYEVEATWGVFDDVICAGNEDAMLFLEDVLDEVVDLFPSEYIHIGGDECPKTRWEKCPKCQDRIKKEKLNVKNGHSPEENLQSYVIRRMERHLNGKGRQIIGWDETLEGGLAPNATVMAWRGMNEGVTAANMGHDVIMTPTSFCYFDYYQTADTSEEPLAIGGYLPLSRVYEFEPVPSNISDDKKHHIIGCQANLWTEYMPTEQQVEYMLMPRLAAMSEVQWSDASSRDYAQFLKRLPNLIAMYDREGVNYGKHIFDVSVNYTANTDKGVLEVELSSLNPEDQIRYTLDGSAPSAASALYTAPLEISEDAKLRSAVIRATGASRTLSQDVQISKSSLKPVQSVSEPSKSYAYNGISSLVDGLKGGRNYKTGRWIGFVGKDVEMVIDMRGETEISNAKVSALVEKGDWIMGATGLSVAVSEDGKNFKTIATEKYDVLGANDANKIYDYQINFAPVKAKFVRVTVNSTQKLPSWHSGAGNPAYLFLDEIEVN